MNDCPSLVAKVNTPKVVWYDTDTSVILRVMLSDVVDYFLLIDRDHLRFSTIVNERKYYLCIYLFGAVIPEKCEHSNLGREIRINIPKGHKCTDWPRLCLDATKSSQITRDLEKVTAKKIKSKKKLSGKLVELIKKNGLVVKLSVPSSAEDTCSENSDIFVDEDW